MLKDKLTKSKSFDIIMTMKMTKTRSGQTAVEWLVVIGIILVIGACVFGWCSRHVWGNKQIIDFNHQKFNVAYVLGDEGKWEKVKIKAWKDWQQSDAVQIIKTDGNAVYTHLRNVKLCVE